MADYVINCIDKPDRDDFRSRIRGIGGDKHPVRGDSWYLPLDVAIGMLKSKTDTFCVYHQQKSDELPVRVEVIIAHREGTEYLKTKSDIDLEDNLLHLRQCDSHAAVLYEMTQRFSG